MHLTPLDWLIIVGYFVITLGIGLMFSRRASQSLADYFISGRSLPWWIAGTSMVATTFAADTPLAVTGLVAAHGLAGNWVWWALAMGGMFTVFVYARLWRRAEVMTDVEFIEIRYAGKPAAALRGLRAVYFALVINPIVIGWVTGAMVTILNEAVLSEPGSIGNTTFAALRAEAAAGLTSEANVAAKSQEELDREAAEKRSIDFRNLAIIVGCLSVVGVYCTLSGLWGVAITDVIQFVTAMFGCIALAVIAVRHVGGMQAMREKVITNFGEGGEQAFNFLPSFANDPWMPLHIFLIYLLVQWWAAWYPGAEPGGGGYIVQRMAACKDERHTLLATLWYQIAHYCLRPWPWLLVAFVALAIYPETRQLTQDPAMSERLGTKADAGFAWVMRDLSPPGLRGLILVTFFAAFMSTISTQMNWGASYLVRDVYQRFYNPNASDAELTKASRWMSVLVLTVGAVVSWQMLGTDINKIWKILLALGAGTGAVYMLRWFWWRVNSWSEISAMFGSLGFFLIFSNYFVDEAGVQTIQDEELMFLVAMSTIVTWLAVTFMTKPEKAETLEKFYRAVRPGGPGWAPVAKQAPDIIPDRHLGLSILAAISASGIVYCTLPGVGFILFGEYGKGIACFVGAVVFSGIMLGLMKKIGWENAL